MIFYFQEMICGQVPVLEVDGIVLGHSMAIARYLARRHNLVGKTDLEAAQADMIVDCMIDAVHGKYQLGFSYTCTHHPYNACRLMPK